MSVVLSPLQDKAVAAAHEWYTESEKPYFYLAGYAGTGKSTILPCVIDKLGLKPEEVLYVAPTGKASRVMTKKLRQFGIMSNAMTIHKAIYIPNGQKADRIASRLGWIEENKASLDYDPQEEIEKLLQELDDLVRHPDHRDNQLSFSLNPDSMIKHVKLIAADEVSMMGARITDDLLSFGVPLFAMGDPGQLPPVRDEAGITDDEPDFFLDEIHRQAADNPIIKLATMARKGQKIRAGSYGDGVRVVERKDDDATYDLNSAAQVIVGTNKRRWMVTKRIRNAMGYTTEGPGIGETLIVCKNSQQYPDLVNGSFVECLDNIELEPGNAYFPVRVKDFDNEGEYSLNAYQALFEEHAAAKKGACSAEPARAYKAKVREHHLDFGWVITCHKSQGSEWDEVVLHDESAAFREDADRWLYTAVTRASKRLTIVL